MTHGVCKRGELLELAKQLRAHLFQNHVRRCHQFPLQPRDPEWPPCFGYAAYYKAQVISRHWSVFTGKENRRGGGLLVTAPRGIVFQTTFILLSVLVKLQCEKTHAVCWPNNTLPLAVSLRVPGFCFSFPHIKSFNCGYSYIKAPRAVITHHLTHEV